MHGLPIDFPNDAPKRLNGDAPLKEKSNISHSLEFNISKLRVSESRLSLLRVCRTGAVSPSVNAANKSKINSKKACFAFEIFVPLHCQIETAATLVLRRKIASIKSRNCAH